MSQSTLAEAVGLTFQQIQKYEKGTNRISASMLYELSRALNVHPRIFFDGIDESAGPPEVPRLQPSRLDIEIIALLGQLQDPTVTRKVYDLLRALAPARVKLPKPD